MTEIKKLIVFAALAALILPACAGPEKAEPVRETRSGFRDVSWGMTPAQVETVETDLGEPEEKTPDSLTYSGELLGEMGAKIVFHFQEGGLVRGTYRLAGDLGVDQVDALRFILGKKYGIPVNSGRSEGMAQTTWRTPGTEIDLLIRGSGLENYRPGAIAETGPVEISSIDINYYDRDYFKKSSARIAKEEKQEKETDRAYHRYVGPWVELYPDYYAYDREF